MTTEEALDGLIAILMKTPNLPTTFETIKVLELKVREGLEKENSDAAEEILDDDTIRFNPVKDDSDEQRES